LSIDFLEGRGQHGRSHTVRGAFAVAQKKKLGLEVQSEKVDPAPGRVYRIAE